MNLILHADVKVVAEFMQCNIAASRLVAVATGLAALAPILWRFHESEAVVTLRLVPQPPISDYDPPKPPYANESVLGKVDVGDGSAGAKA